MEYWAASCGAASPRCAINARAVPPWAATTVSLSSVAYHWRIRTVTCASAGRHEAPPVGFTLGNDMLVPRHNFRVGQPFPFPERDFGKLRFDHVTGGLKPKRRANDLHGFARTHERTRYVVEA